MNKLPGRKHIEKWGEISSSGDAADCVGVLADPFFTELNLSLDAPDVGQMVCDLLTKIDLTESATDPNSVLLAADLLANTDLSKSAGDATDCWAPTFYDGFG